MDKVKLKDFFREPARRVSMARELQSVLPELSRDLPSGNGAPVLIVPGFMLGDRSTQTLRSFLQNQGYQTHGWQQGVNFGPQEQKLAHLQERLLNISRDHDGQPVNLIGFSLGGLYARELARQYPDSVQQVMTMGSPFGMELPGAGFTPLRRLSEVFDASVQGLDDQALLERSLQTLPVPTTAIYSRQDGVVHWKSAMNPSSEFAENIEVQSGHLAMLVNPQVFAILADRLSIGEKGWKPYEMVAEERLELPTQGL